MLVVLLLHEHSQCFYIRMSDVKMFGYIMLNCTELDPTPEVLYRLSRVLEDTAHLMEKLVKRGKHHIWSAIRNWFRAKKDARKIAVSSQN